MKRPRKLTRAMKELLKEHGLNHLNWWYIEKRPDKLVVIHKQSGNIKEITWST